MTIRPSHALILLLAACGMGTAEQNRQAADDLLDSLDLSVGRYAQQHGAPPSALSEAVRTAPVDPWGNTLDYRRLGDDRWELTSFGADGEPGGEGADGDVTLYGRMDR